MGELVLKLMRSLRGGGPAPPPIEPLDPQVIQERVGSPLAPRSQPTPSGQRVRGSSRLDGPDGRSSHSWRDRVTRPSR
ncbi:MAG: hypothetical protein AABZ26_04315 [Chloroflexota bacterium]